VSTQPKQLSLDSLVALCKRRGFMFQSGEIYGGLNGVYDTGPLGVLLKDRIKQLWRENVEQFSEEILYLDGSLLGISTMWEASGHVSNFHDPMVDCMVCKKRYRADEIDLNKPCPSCGNKQWTEVRQFNMMFSTYLGAAQDKASIAYLRPETAQSIFVNFKNIMSSSRVKIPFGVGQIGKAFRNEITPKQFLFRVREFEQMEIEWFCKGETALAFFDEWCTHRLQFYKKVGIKEEHIRLRAYEKDELAHYSQATSDVEYKFPFGWKELEGIAYRGDFDLKQHSKFSGKDLSVYDDATKTSYMPHVVECSIGVGRLMLALLCDAYAEELVDGEPRIVLRFAPAVAPITAAFMPLTKHHIEPMEKLYKEVRKAGIIAEFDEKGSIGKRYRRQDEIGTPVCFTYDEQSAQDNTVTVRHRDTMQQERISISRVVEYLKELLQKR
jgi:glycyl-tRNA synthetase